MKSSKQLETNKIISLSTLLIVIVLVYIFNVDDQVLLLLLFPTILLYFNNKTGIKSTIIHCLLAMLVAFIFWVDYNTGDIMLLLTGGVTAFLLSTVATFFFGKNQKK